MNTTVDELHALIERGATILNVGKHQGHGEIRGAVRYRPHDLLTPEHLAIPIAADKPVVLYDEKGDGDLTRQIADKLRGDGFTDVRALEGGFAAWERAGGETQEPSLEQLVPPMRGSEAQKLDRRV
jgi:3-mercaptopyruvate sulfurtransferase SseA